MRILKTLRIICSVVQSATVKLNFHYFQQTGLLKGNLPKTADLHFLERSAGGLFKKRLDTPTYFLKSSSILFSAITYLSSNHICYNQAHKRENKNDSYFPFETGRSVEYPTIVE